MRARLALLVTFWLAALAPPVGAGQICQSDAQTACTESNGNHYCPSDVSCGFTGGSAASYCSSRGGLLSRSTPLFGSLKLACCMQQSCEAGAAACSDGFDNDSDGLADYPNDPGCQSADDDDELDLPACSDGLDNDNDGLTDHPNDPGCDSETDEDEYNTPACSDGLDNDNDGLTDHPNDPGCDSETDEDEYNTPACSDGLDNDSDGFIDFPNDAGCDSAADDDETSPKACSDGIDNDDDGLIDTSDDGCSSPLDNSEVAVTACGDGQDNDNDSDTDYPNDNGCASYGDSTEDTKQCEGNCFCAYDANNNGEIDTADEMQACTQINGRNQCPLNRQRCEQTNYAVVTNGEEHTVQGYSCPAGDEFSCSPHADGYYCSPQRCADPATAPSEDTDTAEAWPEGDGPRDEEGNCLGSYTIMGGTAKRCRKSGWSTAYQNCCKNRMGKLNDTMGAPGEPSQRSYREEASSFEFWDNQCDTEDQEAALLADSDYCVYLGTYCAKKVSFIGCIQRAKSYCCFNSRLAQMIHKQGRPQLKTLDGYGSKKKPNCRGFTPEEFQSLDFSKMDLGAYASSIRTNAQSTMEAEAQREVRDEASNY